MRWPTLTSLYLIFKNPLPIEWIYGQRPLPFGTNPATQSKKKEIELQFAQVDDILIESTIISKQKISNKNMNMMKSIFIYS